MGGNEIDRENSEYDRAECGGIPFRTWLVVFAILAIGLIRSMAPRPAKSEATHRTTITEPGGKLVITASENAPAL